jgi:hypothetical protein
MDISMDLGAVLDRMRESQHQHAATMEKIRSDMEQIMDDQRYLVDQQAEILEALKAMRKPSRLVTPSVILNEYLRPIGPIAAWWVPGLLALQHILRGGNVQDVLVKLLG